eukprot:6734611-Lingulodinium_polyedra.AAC.1
MADAREPRLPTRAEKTGQTRPGPAPSRRSAAGSSAREGLPPSPYALGGPSPRAPLNGAKPKPKIV